MMLNPNSFLDHLTIIDVITTPVSINATATAYTESFMLPKVSSADFAVIAKCSSGGTISVKFELEQSNSLPSTEGASDTNYVIPDDVAAIFTLADANKQVKAFSPDVTKYGRFKITGTGSNAASTYVDSLVLNIAID